MITVAEAKGIALEWIESNAPDIRGLIGAVIGGSVNFMKDDDPWPKSSDLDIWILVDETEGDVTFALDKIIYRDVILEVSSRGFEGYNTPESILSSPFEGYHFTVPSCVLYDTDNKIRDLIDLVRPRFGEPEWIRKRVKGSYRNARGRFEWNIREREGDYFWKMLNYVLGVKNISAMLTIADLGHPTVRRTMVLCRDVLQKYDRLDFHEEILDLYGARDVTASDVTGLVEGLIPAFRRAAQVVKTPFFTSGTLKEHVIPLFKEGVAQVMEAGYHREAMYPVFFTYWSVYTALNIDALPSEKLEWDAERKQAFGAWGLGDAASVDSRSKRGLELLEVCDKICQEIIDHLHHE